MCSLLAKYNDSRIIMAFCTYGVRPQPVSKQWTNGQTGYKVILKGFLIFEVPK